MSHPTPRFTVRYHCGKSDTIRPGGLLSKSLRGEGLQP